uniref:NocS1 n=1 Tax=Nocardia sp. ATCC 202099 TaxID=930400 RepID=E5DUG2_9NOCA|nr:NocS1 [Nocardia sp. ATCC 202099]
MASHGHVVPTLGVAEELVARGHRVTYPAAGDYATAVAETGARVLPYESVLVGRQLTGALGGGDPVANFELFLAEGAAILRAVRAAYGDRRPDLVVYDQMANGIGRLIAAEWGVPVVQTIPTPVYTDQFWAEDNTGKARGPMGRDPGAVAAAHARMQDALGRHGIDMPVAEYLAATSEALNIVFLPSAFQQDAEKLGERYVFVGPCLPKRDFLGEWRPPASELPVVLISLGTVYNENVDFFRSCVRDFADGAWHVVISLGDGVDPSVLGELPPNVEVHRWVSHAAVLEHASALVTHGGLGSVMTGLHWATPVVVVPVTPLVDIHARVVALGLGTRVEVADVQVGRLREAVDQVANDTAIRTAVAEMREHIRHAGGAAKAAEEIESYLGRVAIA